MIRQQLYRQCPRRFLGACSREDWLCSSPGSTDRSPAEPSVSRRAAAISNAKTIEIRHGATEPPSRAERWPGWLQFWERGDTAQRRPIGVDFAVGLYSSSATPA